METVVTTGATERAKLQFSRQNQHTPTSMPDALSVAQTKQNQKRKSSNILLSAYTVSQ